MDWSPAQTPEWASRGRPAAAAAAAGAGVL